MATDLTSGKISFRMTGFALAMVCMADGRMAGQTSGNRLSEADVGLAAKRIDEVLAGPIWRSAREKMAPVIRQPFGPRDQMGDGAFVRRAGLDLLGSNPEPEMVRAFVADKSPDKYGRLVDRMLSTPASDARRFLQYADMLRVKDEVQGMSLKPYVEWVRQAAVTAKPYDEMVRELISAKGNITTNPATGLLLGDTGHVGFTLTELFRVFLDEEIHCTRCHDHPFADWTQMRFYQAAAYFGSTLIQRIGPQQTTALWPSDASTRTPVITQLGPGESLAITDVPIKDLVRLPARYLYKDGRPGDVVKPAIPPWMAGEERKTGAPPAKDRRAEFAEWMTGSRRFAEVAAMRTWAQLFGTPVHSPRYEDVTANREMTVTSVLNNCCETGIRNGLCNLRIFTENLREKTNVGGRQLLDAFASEFIRARYNVREFERILCRTTAYRRQSVIMELNHPSDMLSPTFRRLPAETIWDNLAALCDGDSVAGRVPRSAELPQNLQADHPANILGRSRREWGDDSLPWITHEMTRLAMNGEPGSVASAENGALVKRLSAMPDQRLAAEEVWLRVLGRLPSEAEAKSTINHVQSESQSANGWGNVVWALLNTSEFLFQQ